MADISHIKGPDNTSYDIKDATARSSISNLATVASTGEYSDLLHRPTVAEIDDHATVNNKTWSSSKISAKLHDPVTFKTKNIPEEVGSLSDTATAHCITAYRNGLSIPYKADDTNDGGILRVRGTTESDCILELGMWDDSGAGETIQFNYYPATSQVTPTYSVSVPKKSGTIALTGDVVAKNGDTMTGDLTMQASSIKEDFSNSAQNGELSIYYNEDKASYSTQSVPRDYVICTKDKNDWAGAYLDEQTSNQGCRTSIGARTYWSNGTLAQNMYFGVKVGTPYDTPAFEISHPKLLLDNSTSIGKLTSGTGTKTNNWTASGGVTCNWVRSGHVVTVEYSFTVTIASGSSIARWTNLFTGLPKAYSSSCWILGEGGSPLIINTNGQLQNVYQWGSGSIFYRDSCTYLTDDFS